MNRRVLVNLVFFATIGVVLTYWAIGSVLQIDLHHPPYTLTADFEDSPGLQSGYDVGYLGTPIGRIRHVRLEEGHVEVEMAIEPDHRIPEGSQFAVRRKSAVGEPYVDIIPPDGADEDGPFLEEGAHIPIEQTITPLSYSELFHALDDLVGTIPEDDLGTFMREFANAIDGRAGSIRDLITGGDDSLETFAEHSELLERATASFARLSRVFADHGDSLGQGLENTRALTGSLANARRDMERVLTDGDSLATRTADLVAGSEEDLTCIIDGLSTVTVGLDRPEVLAALEELLGSAAGARDVWRDIIAWEPDGPYVRAIPPLNVGGEAPVPVYPSPRPLPDVASPVGCAEMDPNGAPGGAEAAGPGGRGTADAGASSAADPGPNDHTAPELASSDDDVGGGGFNPLLVILGLLAVASIAAIRPWRFRHSGTKPPLGR
jgi:phospholipid/cholesterol/gamma-HCH transport system substrate-binding protein